MELTSSTTLLMTWLSIRVHWSGRGILPVKLLKPTGSLGREALFIP